MKKTNARRLTEEEIFTVESNKKKQNDMKISEEDRKEVEELREKYGPEELFNKLAASIAPQIYGLEHVKKALLLLLAGGVTTVINESMKIRGEINVMLVGDPGVGKSQLLKCISLLTPRGIFTTCKGSSDEGLIASINTDPATKEVILEAGALVLADMGVCCINEFEKMNNYDKTTIHEVMDNQTISIAKAGLDITLNARTSILAAANPVYSRYKPTETPQSNINLPAAIFSRFDLIFILLDKCDPESDLALSKHIGNVHRGKVVSKVEQISQKTLKNFIALSKEYEPKISQQMTGHIIESYQKERQRQTERSGEDEQNTRYMPVLIRLSQARAKLRFSNEISLEDIEDCEKIIEESQRNAVNTCDERNGLADATKEIFNIIKQMCKDSPSKGVGFKAIEKRAINRGYSKQQLLTTVQHYELKDMLVCFKNKIFLE